MARKKKKYYTVWVGASTGVFDNWTDCQLQIKNYPGAKYKSYETKEEAVEAYRGDPDSQLGIARAIAQRLSTHPRSSVKESRDYTSIPGIRLDAIAVDGACAGNPGVMEYRAVRVIDGVEIFRRGADGTLIGTNNIGEYLAIVHIAAMLAARGDSTTPIYSDSRTALSWIRHGHSKTSLERTPRTARVLDVLARADAWMANNRILNPVLKWNTEEWGEIPADFGRK